MSSEVSICNQALSWLGVSPILTLDDVIKPAQLCKANYAQLRDTVLEEANWTFATKRFKFQTPEATAPVYGYANSFLVPTTTLLVVECNDTAEPQGDYDLDWRYEDNRIVTDAAIVYAKCIVQVTDPKKFTNTFRQALAARIAAELAVPLTESSAKETKMWNLYAAKLGVARSVDGKQGASDRLKSRSRITRAR